MITFKLELISSGGSGKTRTPKEIELGVCGLKDIVTLSISTTKTIPTNTVCEKKINIGIEFVSVSKYMVRRPVSFSSAYTLYPPYLALIRYFQAWSTFTWARLRRALLLDSTPKIIGTFAGKMGMRGTKQVTKGVWKLTDDNLIQQHYPYRVMPARGVEVMRKVAYDIAARKDGNCGKDR